MDYLIPEYRSFAITLCDKDGNAMTGPDPYLRFYETNHLNQCVLPSGGLITWRLPSARQWVVKDGERDVLRFGGTILQETIMF